LFLERSRADHRWQRSDCAGEPASRPRGAGEKMQTREISMKTLRRIQQFLFWTLWGRFPDLPVCEVSSRRGAGGPLNRQTGGPPHKLLRGIAIALRRNLETPNLKVKSWTRNK